MAPVTLAVVSFLYVFQALAAPLPRRAISSNLACTRPNSDVSAAQVSLAGINPISDVTSPGPLLSAQLLLVNASAITQAVAGFAPADGTAAVTVDANSQALLLSQINAAQSALAGVKALGNANANKTAQALLAVDKLLTKAVTDAGAINSDCLAAGAATAAAGTGAAGAPGSAATTVVGAGAPGSAATTVVGAGAPGSAATTVFGAGAQGSSATDTTTGLPPAQTFTLPA
ncbi:hypothetical protein DFH06DRAFT_1306905 [Mycena polygramma]|nr:hypothetical protein DFH06DRAFT_1306905 [Mycena polygramma]